MASNLLKTFFVTTFTATAALYLLAACGAKGDLFLPEKEVPEKEVPEKELPKKEAPEEEVVQQSQEQAQEDEEEDKKKKQPSTE